MSEAIEPTRPELARGDGWLFAAGLAGPTAWLAQLCLGLAMVGDLCAAHARWPFHATTAGALATTIVGIAVCWRWRPADPTRRACASVGIALGMFFGLVNLALEIPGLVLDPCL